MDISAASEGHIQAACLRGITLRIATGRRLHRRTSRIAAALGSHCKQLSSFPAPTIGICHRDIKICDYRRVGNCDIGREFAGVNKGGRVHCDASGISCAGHEPLRLRAGLEAFAGYFHVEINRALRGSSWIGRRYAHLTLSDRSVATEAKDQDGDYANQHPGQYA